MIARTGQIEVFIDDGAGIRPGGLGADLRDLFVQPIGEIGRVTRGVKIEDVVNVPWAGEGSKDVVVAVSLGVATISIFLGSGALEYLGSSQYSEKWENKPSVPAAYIRRLSSRNYWRSRSSSRLPTGNKGSSLHTRCTRGIE